jgi:hypothetical protein
MKPIEIKISDNAAIKFRRSETDEYILSYTRSMQDVTGLFFVYNEIRLSEEELQPFLQFIARIEKLTPIL